MKERDHHFQINNLCFLIPLLLFNACSSNLVDASIILKKMCEQANNQGTMSVNFLLEEDGTLILGTTAIFDDPIYLKVLDKKGNFNINTPITKGKFYLHDGRIVVHHSSGPFSLKNDEILVIETTLSEETTIVNASRNCSNPNQIPPIVKPVVNPVDNNNRGFSPSHGSKPAPTSYRGF